MADREPDLFSYPYRPGVVPDCDTSIAAADSLADDKLSRLRLQVFVFIKGRGDHGATCDEVEVELNMRHQTASARIRELSLFGWINDSSRRRLTRSRRNARVYVENVSENSARPLAPTTRRAEGHR